MAGLLHPCHLPPNSFAPPTAMHDTPALPDTDLAQARTAWLRGDPRAWSRYADCLTRLAHPTAKADGRTKTPGRIAVRGPRPQA